MNDSRIRMARRLWCGLLALTAVLSLAACTAVGDVTTDHARNYVYTAGEAINFYDEINDRKPLGTLVVISAETLAEGKFVHTVHTGTDAQGNAVYTDVLLQQIVQINYTYQATEAGRQLTKKDFSVYDAHNREGTFDPDVPYTTTPAPGMYSLIVGLPRSGDKLTLEVRYSGVISPNAIVRLATDGTAPPPTTSTPDPAQQEIDRLTALLAQKQAEIDALRASEPAISDAAQQEIDRLTALLAEKQAEIDVLRTDRAPSETNGALIVVGLLALVFFALAIVFMARFAAARRRAAEERLNHEKSL